MKHLKTFVVAVVLMMTATQVLGQNSSENFLEFWRKYKSDFSFQKQRTVFPVPFIYYDFEYNGEPDDGVKVTEYIQADKWKFETFRNSSEAHIEIEQRNDTYEVWYRGNECGIATSFIFRRRSGRWYLTQIVDYSD